MIGGCRFCPELAGEIRTSEFHELTDNQIECRYIRESDNFAVLPALGHITPGHLLLCTKPHWLCMAQIAPILFDELEGILAATCARVSKVYGTKVLVYEHGQMSPEDRCGACVEHAHLHILPVSGEVDERMRATIRTSYAEREIALFDELPSMVGGEGYLLLFDTHGSRFFYPAPIVASQYLRKQACDAMGLSHRWDWRANVSADGEAGTVAAIREVMAKVGEGWGNVNGGLRYDRVVDAMTGAHNRGFLDDYLTRELARAARYQRAMSVVLIDLDHLRHINDRGGHFVGDVVLQEVSRRIRGQMRKEEILVHHGSGKFVVALPETAHDSGLKFAERIRDIVASRPVVVSGEEFPITISAGLATVNGEEIEAHQFLGRADANLSEAKRLGKNRVVG
jgi:diguanylate cyclase (GGDEF)-like protein